MSKISDKTPNFKLGEGAENETNVIGLPVLETLRRKRRIVMWVGGVIAAVVVVMLVLWFSPLLAVKNINVHGTKLSNAETLTSKLDSFKGTPLPQVSSERVLKLLQEDPTVQDVVVQAQTPATLDVQVIEYVPVAIRRDENGENLVAADGHVLVPATKEHAESLPLIELPAGNQDPAVFSAVTTVLGELRADVRSQLTSATASTIDSVQLKLSDGRTIVWGSAADGAKKAAVLEALLTVDPKESGQTIDVSSPDHPVSK